MFAAPFQRRLPTVQCTGHDWHQWAARGNEGTALVARMISKISVAAVMVASVVRFELL